MDHKIGSKTFKAAKKKAENLREKQKEKELKEASAEKKRSGNAAGAGANFYFACMRVIRSLGSAS